MAVFVNGIQLVRLNHPQQKKEFSPGEFISKSTNHGPKNVAQPQTRQNFDLFGGRVIHLNSHKIEVDV